MWLSTVLMAETWSIPPWQVLGQDQPTAWDRWKWIIREREYLKQKAKRENEAQHGGKSRHHH